MSRPDRLHRVAVDFAPPRSRGTRRLALVLVVVSLIGLAVIVTELLLR